MVGKIHKVCSQGITLLGRELAVSWQFVAGDLSSAVVPPFLFMFAAWRTAGAQWTALPVILLQEIVYFWLYIYGFCLANQLVGITEDRENKPHRPLVRGVISPRGAWHRWLVVMALFDILAVSFGVLKYAFIWQLIIVVHNFAQGAKNWFIKHISMSIGIVVQLAAAWSIITPITPIAWRWILLPASVIFPLVTLQDLRDVEGDTKAGRKTVPILLGQTITRMFLSVGFVILPLVVHYLVMVPAGSNWRVWFFDILLALCSLLIAVRVFLLRTRLADHHSYLLLTYWYCLFTFSAVMVL